MVSVSTSVELHSGSVSARVDRAGARVSSLQVDGIELLTALDVPGADASMLSGIFPMAPYAGRVGNGQLDVAGKTYTLPHTLDGHAAHGSVRHLVWEVNAADQKTARLSTGLGADWPFEGRAALEVELSETRLLLALSVTAVDEQPVWLGFHPWFARRLVTSDGHESQPAVLSFEAGAKYAKTVAGLPTGDLVDVGTGPFDDAFVHVTSVAVEWPNLLQLELSADTSTWVMFDANQLAVCAEPQTAPPDALRLGLAPMLSSGDVATLNFAIVWHLLNSSDA